MPPTTAPALLGLARRNTPCARRRRSAWQAAGNTWNLAAGLCAVACAVHGSGVGPSGLAATWRASRARTAAALRSDGRAARRCGVQHSGCLGGGPGGRQPHCLAFAYTLPPLFTLMLLLGFEHRHFDRAGRQGRWQLIASHTATVVLCHPDLDLSPGELVRRAATGPNSKQRQFYLVFLTMNLKGQP